jgi:hypothetical protein
MRALGIMILLLLTLPAYGQTNPRTAAYQRLPGETDQEYRTRVDKMFASRIDESLGKLKALAEEVTIPIYPGVINGEKFLKFSEAERTMYTTGLLDGLLSSTLMGKDAADMAARLSKCLVGKTNSQMAEIIKRYIDKDPARWDLGANVLGFEAIFAACK